MAKLPDASMLQTREPQPGMGVASYNPSVIDAAAPGLGYSHAQESIAQTVDKGGKELLAAIAKKQEEVDTTAVEDAWNKYQSAAIDVTHGPNGVLNLQGGNAVNMPGGMLATTEQALALKRQEIGSTLTNKDQEARFAQRTAATDLGVKAKIVGHLAQQQTVFRARR